jgi:hypothetical protein
VGRVGRNRLATQRLQPGQRCILIRPERIHGSPHRWTRRGRPYGWRLPTGHDICQQWLTIFIILHRSRRPAWRLLALVHAIATYPVLGFLPEGSGRGHVPASADGRKQHRMARRGLLRVRLNPLMRFQKPGGTNPDGLAAAAAPVPTA